MSKSTPKSLAGLMRELLNQRIDPKHSRITYRKQILTDLRNESINKDNDFRTRMKIIEMITKILREEDQPPEQTTKANEVTIYMPDIHSKRFAVPTENNEDSNEPGT